MEYEPKVSREFQQEREAQRARIEKIRLHAAQVAVWVSVNALIYLALCMCQTPALVTLRLREHPLILLFLLILNLGGAALIELDRHGVFDEGKK